MRSTLLLIASFVILLAGACVFVWQSPCCVAAPTMMDDVEEALEVIESGQDIILRGEIFFPTYMSRFVTEPVDSREYADELPGVTVDHAIKIIDTKTGYAWLTNGVSPYFRVGDAVPSR